MYLLKYLIANQLRHDIQSCFKFLYIINQALQTLLSTPNKIVQQNYNYNQLIQLSIRIISFYSQGLPQYLINQAFRFIVKIYFPIALESAKNDTQNEQKLKQIVLLIFGKVYEIHVRKGFGLIPFIYQFLAFFVQKQYIKHISQQLLSSMIIKQLQKIFPILTEKQKQEDINENFNILNQEFQKINQYYDNLLKLNNNNKVENQQKNSIIEQNNLNINKSKEQIQKKNLALIIQRNARINTLICISIFLNRYFIYLKSDKNERKDNLGQKLLVSVLSKLSKLIACCNHPKIFMNHLQLYCLSPINSQNQPTYSKGFIIQQLLNNCPYLFQYFQSCRNYSETQQFSLHCIHLFIKQLNKSQLIQILKMIKLKIQKQYDQSFDKYQFSAACNLLVFLITNFSLKEGEKGYKYKNDNFINNQNSNNSNLNEILNKNIIIQWIKMLLNLNESCLVKHRPIIVQKTYQVISVSFQIIVPGNQYLQQVIQKQLIDSYPSKRKMLQDLIQFYSKNSLNIFKQGYYNKIAVKNFIENKDVYYGYEVNESQKGKNEKVEINQMLRKVKIISRVYEKMLDSKLEFNEKVELWKIVFKVHQMKSKSQNNKLEIEQIRKIHADKVQQTIAKHFACQQFDQKIKNMFSLSLTQLKKLSKHMQIWPIYYNDILIQMKKIQKQIIN